MFFRLWRDFVPITSLINNWRWLEECPNKVIDVVRVATNMSTDQLETALRPRDEDVEQAEFSPYLGIQISAEEIVVDHLLAGHARP